MSVPFEIPDWLLDASAPRAPPDTSVDPHRVEDLVNNFIAGKQEALFAAADAYYRTTGRDAVQQLPYITNRLTNLKNEVIAQPLPYYPQASDQLVAERLPYDPQTSNQYHVQPLTDGERAALGERLDAHIAEAMDGIDRHVAAQRDILTRQIISERQRLIQNAAALEHNNDDKLAGLAEAHASAARELARMNGEPEGPAMDAARSAIWRTAIDQRLATGNGPQAVDLFDRVRRQLAPDDHLSLDRPVQVVRDDHAANQWIASQTGTDGPPLQERAVADPDLPPDAKFTVRAKVDARDSANESARAAKVQELDDQARNASSALATNPGAYTRATLARIADAYDAAGEIDKAALARQFAVQEPALESFAQAGVDKQRRMIDELPPGELRDSAQAIQAHQADAFAHDAFGAGTALYKEVGRAVPIDDIAGRIRQAREIAQLRGVSVVPFTAAEIDGLRQALATGSSQDKQAVRALLAAVPNEMRPEIEPAIPDTTMTASTSSAGTPQSPPPDAEQPPGEDKASPSPIPAATADNALAGADVHVVHQDDGTAKITASGVRTPAGPADVSASIDRDRRSASAMTVLPDGRRIESRRTTPDGRIWSQIDTVRDADGTVRATLTTTFDGTRYSQTYAPADGDARTATWGATRNPDSPVQKVSGDEPLRLFTIDNFGTGLDAGAPIAGAAMLGLALYALKSSPQDQGKPAPIEARRPQDGDDDDDDNTRGRKRRGPRDNPRPPVEGEVPHLPGSSVGQSSGQTGQQPQLPVRTRPHEASNEEIEDIGDRIGRGHADEKHREDQKEFPEFGSELELVQHVTDIIKKHEEWKDLPRDRTAYLDKQSGTVVIHNPHEEDRGTVLRPPDARKYYDDLDKY